MSNITENAKIETFAQEEILISVLDTARKIFYKLISDKEDKYRYGILEVLGTDGIKFVTSEKFKCGDILHLKIKLLELEPSDEACVEADGEIISIYERKTYFPHPEKLEYEYSVLFQNIDEKERKKIVKYITYKKRIKKIVDGGLYA